MVRNISPSEALTKPDLSIQSNYNSATQKQGVDLAFTHPRPTPCGKAEKCKCLIFDCSTPIQEDPRKCPSHSVRACSSNVAPSGVCSHQEFREGPQTNWAVTHFRFTAKMCDSFSNFGLSSTFNMHYVSICPLHTLFSISLMGQIGVENVERNKENFSACFFSE